MLLLIKVLSVYFQIFSEIGNSYEHWRRQRSKGARSFRGQKILQPDARFSSKKLTFFSCRPQNTGRQCRFTVKIKQIKRWDMVTFLFSVHTITKAKQ